MALPTGAARSNSSLGAMRPDPGLDGPDWHEPEKARRDWLKTAIVAGLGCLSWVATYVGMLELIQANMGELPLVHKAIIAFSVAMLMVMVVWLLDKMFSPATSGFTKTVYAAGYLFLTVISVGFGFGFYWKVLESRSESSRSAESAIGQVQQSLHAASTRLEQLQATLQQLTAVSTTQAEVERTKGTSCPNSRPGDGPRRKLRDEDASRFTFASEFVRGRVTAVNTELAQLNGELAKIIADDKSLTDAKSGTRNEALKSLGRKLDMSVTGFNAFRTDPQLKQIRTDLAERAERSTFPDSKGGTFACPDSGLSTALKGVVRAIDHLPELEKPKIAAVEGSEATIEAFRRLTATFYGLLSFKLPPSADELREMQKKAVQSVENPAAQNAARAAQNEVVGLSKRDYVPLAIAVFVDLCLLLVAMGRTNNRLNGLVPKMRAAERGPVIQILSRFNDIHRDAQVRENFEIFRHVVFDYAGSYYVAVPLDAPPKLNPKEREDLRVEAQLLANLFSSFEKDSIFKRIDNRFLAKLTWSEPNAARARRRLKQQGSKFANSEAFRIYRFNDGAWSEIILGAVMGAARRVESDKRRRLVEEGHKLPDAKMASGPAPMPPPYPFEPGRFGQVAQNIGRQGAQPEAGARRPAPPPPLRAAEGQPRPAATRAGFDQQPRDGGLDRATGTDGRGASGGPAMAPAARAMGTRPEATTRLDDATLAQHVAQFGPYARLAAQETAAARPADALQRPRRMTHPEVIANNNTGPSPHRIPDPELPAAEPNAAMSMRPAAQPVALSDKVIAMPGVQVQAQGMIEPQRLAATQPQTSPQQQTRAEAPAEPTEAVLTTQANRAGQDNITLEVKTATITAPASDPRMQAALWRAGMISRNESERLTAQAAPTLEAIAEPVMPVATAASTTAPKGGEIEPQDGDTHDDDSDIRIDMISRRFAPRAGE